MVDKALWTVGVFAGIIARTSGKLLLRRRVEQGSIIPGKSFQGNWELPGGGVMESDNMSYGHLVYELEREIREELGIRLELEDYMPQFYSMPFRGKNREGNIFYDLALVTPILVDGDLAEAKVKIIWVSATELNDLAKEFVAPNKQAGTEGKGLLSGWGKRMHCMALAALAKSSSLSFSQIAHDTLTEIQMHW